jgi:hypothetical protein
MSSHFLPQTKGYIFEKRDLKSQITILHVKL